MEIRTQRWTSSSWSAAPTRYSKDHAEKPGCLCSAACFHLIRFKTLSPLSFLLQKFGSIRADVIEQMRFKQRLRVIQTIEDTTKRNVVRIRPVLIRNVPKDTIRLCF